MRVVMTFDFDEDERERITRYFRDQNDLKGLPKLATRELLRRWIGEAVNSHWIDVEDVEASIEEREKDY